MTVTDLGMDCPSCGEAYPGVETGYAYYSTLCCGATLDVELRVVTHGHRRKEKPPIGGGR